MNLFLNGAISMGFAMAGLFFFRFWRETQDRLFLFFALAFCILAGSRVGLMLAELNELNAHNLYWVRLAAFVLILAGIIDKNRSRKRVGSHGI